MSVIMQHAKLLKQSLHISQQITFKLIHGSTFLRSQFPAFIDIAACGTFLQKKIHYIIH